MILHFDRIYFRKNRYAEIFALQKGESSKIEVKCELFIILMWWLWDEQRPLKKKEEDSLFCQRLSKKSLWIHYIRHNISKSLAAFCSSIKRANDDGVYYRVSQQVWNSLNVIFWSSEVCIQRLRSFQKNVFYSKNLPFQPFLSTAKLKMEYFSIFVLFQLSYIVTYLVNCLKLEKSCWKIHFQFCSSQKKAQKAIFWSKIHIFFCKRCSLRSQTFWTVFQTCWDPQ